MSKHTIAEHEEALDYLIELLRPDRSRPKPPAGFRAVIRASVKADGDRPISLASGRPTGGSLTLSVFDHRGREFDRTRHWLTTDDATRLVHYYRFEQEQVERIWPEPKFRGACPSCGNVSMANRRDTSSCAKCGPGKFDERFLIVWTRNTVEVSHG
tara:strand:+ start:2634 stop:3101 length:468 start_codon:yes stop_codon:yes gene_type:complete